MQDIFYAILTACIIVYFVFVFTNDDIKNDESKLIPYSGYVVTNKVDNIFLSNSMTLRKDSLSYYFTSDDIIYDKYQVGDTLK